MGGSLSPPGSLILETTELEYTSATINAVGFDVVASWEYTLTSELGDGKEDGRNFKFNGAGNTFTIDYFNELMLFPIQHIDYMKDDVTRIRINSWEDLPSVSDSPEIVLMREDWKDLIEWTLTVTAIGTVSGMPSSVTDTYTIIVYANYDSSRNLLKGAVDARRHV
jgi:hypothetical protein